MTKETTPEKDNTTVKKGYNEKNPGQSEGAFPAASTTHKPKEEEIKSNAADKKAKEDQD